jgi:hypothetical protein
MDGLISVAAPAIVVCAALYLLALGAGALVQPATARRFLGGFATTPQLHYTELALRILAGAAFVLNAPRMAFGSAILVFGWILIATSLVLALVPWRLHQRFAAWSVPKATQHMSLIGLASLAGGCGLIAALFLRGSV